MITLNALADTILTLVLLAPCFAIGLLMIIDAITAN